MYKTKDEMSKKYLAIQASVATNIIFIKFPTKLCNCGHSRNYMSSICDNFDLGNFNCHEFDPWQETSENDLRFI